MKRSHCLILALLISMNAMPTVAHASETNIKDFDLIRCPAETTVIADYSGLVSIENNKVIIKHDKTDEISIYANLDNITVKSGQKIKKGEKIGTDENTFNYQRRSVTDTKNLGIDANIIKSYRYDIAEYACQFVGNPYVHGGTSLTEGADCSGFIYTLFRTWDIDISRSAQYQYDDALKVTEKELTKGDLIFYGKSADDIEHVALYIGDGKVVHASNSAPYPDGGIKISNYNYREPIGYGRY